ncbi:MAG: glycoside hydrolase family 88 protein [Clostridia bacterium]|nr:glycoside hydrolase family 88 protein [Clostridia bacterium]
MYSNEFIFKQTEKINGYRIDRNKKTENAKPDISNYMLGNMAAYEMTHTPEYMDYAMKWAKENKWQMNAERNKKDTCINPESFLGGEAFLRVLEFFAAGGTDDYIIEASKELLKDDGNDDWRQVDAIYTAFPFLNKMGVKYRNPEYIKKAHKLFRNCCFDREFYDMEEKLWYKDGERVFYAKENGMVFAGIARGLDALVDSSEYYEEYKKIFVNMAEKIRKLISSDGGYKAVLDSEEALPCEIIGTELFTLGFLMGVRIGILDKSYLETAYKGFEWLNMKFEPEVKDDFVIGTYLLILRELWLINKEKDDKYENKDAVKWADEILKKADKKLLKYAREVREFIPGGSENDKYIPSNGGVFGWTNGFWGGTMWLMYLESGNEAYREAAEHSEKLLDGAFSEVKRLSHDAGFMWLPAAGAHNRINPNPESEERLLKAATVLASRYNADGGYIRPWNGDGTRRFREIVIIDCMMNLPLLFWASEYTKDERFKRIAMHHADKVMEHHVRTDGSVYHMVRYDEYTGEVVNCEGGQGYSEDSSWTRGQVWAIYGFLLCYIYTGKKEYLETSKKVANYFIAAASSNDWLVKCDFRSPEEPVLYDTTAAMGAASAMILLSEYVDKYEKKMYFDSGFKILKASVEKFADWSDNTAGIMDNGCIWYHGGKKEKIIYGDFYLVEALSYIKGNKILMW